MQSHRASTPLYFYFYFYGRTEPGVVSRIVST